MLTKAELDALDARMGDNADKLIQRVTRTLVKARPASATGPKPVVMANVIQQEMLEVLHAGEEKWPLWVDDVLQGVARLEWYGNERARPLSTRNILKCFAYLDNIDVYGISHLLRVAKRQAQRYMGACQLAQNYLIAGYCDDTVRTMHYPEVFVYPRDPNTQSDLGD